MTERTETCTPEERVFLDLLHKVVPFVSATQEEATIGYRALDNDDPSGFKLANAYRAAVGLDD